jgi:Rrf2 family transcriptional regulator, nitric oxide-sensitive transcriptional repressor
MRLTSHADYALRILLYLAIQRDRVVSTDEIAQGYGISKNHLTKIVGRLGHEGYIEVRRGRGGGIKLGREPREINVGAVVRAFESSLAVVECLDMETNTCVVAPACGLKGVFDEATEAFLAVLDGYTLELVDEKRARALRALLLS